jgi:hypothetical protein
MTPTGEELVSVIHELIEATEDLQAALEAQNQLRREELLRLEAGEPLRDIVDSLPLATYRTRSKAAQEQMEARRKDLRRVLMKQCIDEGLTNKDIARIWGVSVQLISRYTAVERTRG